MVWALGYWNKNNHGRLFPNTLRGLDFIDFGEWVVRIPSEFFWVLTALEHCWLGDSSSIPLRVITIINVRPPGFCVFLEAMSSTYVGVGLFSSC